MAAKTGFHYFTTEIILDVSFFQEFHMVVLESQCDKPEDNIDILYIIYDDDGGGGGGGGECVLYILCR